MNWLRYVFILFLLASLQAKAATISPTQESFQLGETLTYQVHYGWLDAGLATMKIDPQWHVVNGKTCYKIDVAGESKGLLYLFLKMKNEFGSYLDKDQLFSQGSYRSIQEGKYRKKERVRFDLTKKLAIVERLATEGDTEVPLDTVSFPIGDTIQDIVSNWYVLRIQDFKQVKVGDILTSPIFFDDVLYPNFKTKFLGRKRIKTKLGSIPALVLAPRIPFTAQGTSIFADENAVELFLSDDENKIPLKINKSSPLPKLPIKFNIPVIMDIVIVLVLFTR